MKTHTKIMLVAGTILGLAIAAWLSWFVFWEGGPYTRQEIRMDTGEIREVREWGFWDSAPSPARATVVTPILARHELGMKALGSPWVYFGKKSRYGEAFSRWDMRFLDERRQWRPVHYGDFLDAVSKYRSREEAAIWWRIFIHAMGEWPNRGDAFGYLDLLTRSPKTSWSSQEEFDRWYENTTQSDDYRFFLDSVPELRTLAPSPPPQP